MEKREPFTQMMGMYIGTVIMYSFPGDSVVKNPPANEGFGP